jgi:hypothetical protein
MYMSARFEDTFNNVGIDLICGKIPTERVANHKKAKEIKSEKVYVINHDYLKRHCRYLSEGAVTLVGGYGKNICDRSVKKTNLVKEGHVFTVHEPEIDINPTRNIKKETKQEPEPDLTRQTIESFIGRKKSHSV